MLRKLLILTVVLALMIPVALSADTVPINCFFNNGGNNHLVSYQCEGGNTFGMLQGQVHYAIVNVVAVEFRGATGEDVSQHIVLDSDQSPVVVDYGTLSFEPELYQSPDTHMVLDFGMGWQITVNNLSQNGHPRLILSNQDSGFTQTFSLTNNKPLIQFTFFDDVQELVVDGQSLALLSVAPGVQNDFTITAWGEFAGATSSHLHHLRVEAVAPVPPVVDEKFEAGSTSALRDYVPSPLTHTFVNFYGKHRDVSVSDNRAEVNASVSSPVGYLIADTSGAMQQFPDGFTLEVDTKFHETGPDGQTVWIVNREIFYLTVSQGVLKVQFAGGPPVEIVDADYHGIVKVVRDNADGTKVYWNDVMVLNKSEIDMQDPYASLRFDGIGFISGGGSSHKDLFTSFDSLTVTLP